MGNDRSQGRDLRTWLAKIDEIGELTRVSGADWDIEIGAISQLNYRRERPSALLFDDITGYPGGFRVVSGTLSNARRLGITLGLGDDMDDRRLVEALQGLPLAWERDAPEFEPVVVDDAPVLRNVVAGKDADLTRFPAPRWNELDGGRYLGTGCIVLTRDPETGVVNGGAYRMQIQDEGRSVTVNAIPGKHGDQHIQRWFAREGRAPVTVSLGHDPLLLMVAGTEVPTGTSELNYAGAILGEPLSVLRSEVTGLPIPASSEIVVEGWLRPDKRRPEGPFGEWTGYYSGSQRPVLALDVERVLHRDDPILLGAPPGKPPHDYSYMRTVLKSAMIQDALVKTGVPGVRGVWAHEAGGGRMFIAVSVEQRYFGHSRQVGHLTAQSPAAAYMNRYVVVVDEDVDPRRLDDVIWAMCSRSDPSADIDVIRRTWGSKADPLLVDHSVPYNSRAVIDACVPFERRDDFPPVAQIAPGLLAATAERWGHLFPELDPGTFTGAASASTGGGRAATAMTDG
ncbi:UbiD family decarboxylase [Streptomyces sp. 4N509B]|uniref:UbiD family decarboxylase n=1 Tax=Streptomyces sp. 4N509B TaxID=3457413 RepID=UPI003FD4B09A